MTVDDHVVEAIAHLVALDEAITNLGLAADAECKPNVAALAKEWHSALRIIYKGEGPRETAAPTGLCDLAYAAYQRKGLPTGYAQCDD
jgi:hypothetical protein